MPRRRTPFRPFFLLLMAALVSACGGPDRSADATVFRDAYGVPHIFSPSEEAGMYAFGYAQAEDRLTALLRNYKQARGELSEIDGAAALPGDIRTRAFRLREIGKEKYGALSPQVRADIEAFCAGVNRFQKDNPGRRPAWAFEAAPADVVAFAQFINLAFATDPFEQPPAPGGRGSNAFALSGKKTASGKGAIVSLDPHLPWDGFLRWYEAHLACGPMNVTGITFAGLPFLVMGHNGRVAWANTVNLPDLSDLYEERLAPEKDPAAYAYDGGQRPLERRTFTFRVKQPDGSVKEEAHAIAYTHHGPLLLQAGGKAYAVRKAGWGDVGLFDQVRAQCLAQTVDEYRKALAGRHVVLFNHVFADASGRVGYVWGGQIPRRPAGYDFRSPVPGWLKATEWGDPVPFDELPRAFDPPAGFLQNCNDGPFYAAPEVKLSPSADRARYPHWLAPDVRTARGVRLTHLLRAAPRISPHDAKAIATDVLDLTAARELPALLAAARTSKEFPAGDKPLLDECLNVLAAWDGHLTADARGAALFHAWLSHPAVQPLIAPPLLPPTQPAPAVARLHPDQAVRALLDTARTFRQRSIALDTPWGQIHRHRRGAVDLPLDGGGDSLTPNNGLPDLQGKIVATQGASFRMVVELGNGPARAWSYAPYGNSDDPASPHHADQMPLAAKRQYRPLPFTRGEVEAEAKSRRTLTWPEQ